MLDELVSRVFKDRNAAHSAHWTTKSYAQHKALGHFYDDVITAIDKYVEAHQGTFGQADRLPEQEPNIAAHLREEMLWIIANRAKISKKVPSLENLLDELTAVYMTTLYKLENLR